MQILTTFENNPITVEDNVVSIAKEALSQNPSLPFHIEKNTLIFDEYTVGSIRFGEFLININCRNEAISLQRIFEMMLYNSGIKNYSTTIGFDFKQSDGIFALPQVFVNVCLSLVKAGLSGGYVTNRETGYAIKGSIDFSQFQKQNILTKGLTYEYTTFSIDILQNQIIKEALHRCKGFASDADIPNINYCLSVFNDVSSLNSSIENEQEILSYSTYNSYYKLALKIALIILKDIKMTFSQGNGEWFSFFANSNDLFEEFARNIVKNVIKERAEKWDEAIPFASIFFNGQKAYKSYVPDIVVNYSKEMQRANAVLDAKNKKFNPENDNLSDLISSPDLYQLLFYCRQLKTKIGALIYPAKKSFAPVKVIVNDDANLNIALLSINMTSPISLIEQKLKEDIYKYVLLKI